MPREFIPAAVPTSERFADAIVDLIATGDPYAWHVAQALINVGEVLTTEEPASPVALTVARWGMGLAKALKGASDA